MKQRITPLMPGILLSGAISFLIFFYAPMEIYSGNLEEFWFGPGVQFVLSAVMFLISTLVLTGIYALLLKIHKVAYRIGIAGGLSLLVCTYVQGTFLIKKLPSLDGNAIYWEKYEALRTESVILWGIVLTAVILLYIFCKRELFFKVAEYISVCLTLMLAVTTVSVLLTSGAMTQRSHLQVTKEDEFAMSEDTNFIIFVLDSVDGREFETQLAKHPEYADIFSDFTWFRNTTCAYPCTKHSIPYILSGEWYENQEPFEEYLKRIYAEAPLLQELEDRGYRMALYEDEPYTQDAVMTRFDNIHTVEVGVKSWMGLAKQELKLIGFRYAPYDLKKLCNVKKVLFDEQMEVRASQTAENYTQNNYAFKTDLLSQGVTVDNNGKRFKFIHLEGAHVPYAYDENADSIDYSEGSYAKNVEASVALARFYIEGLKNSGAYDNTAIVVMADHGYNGDVDGNDAAFMRQDAMLLIKGVEEQHDTMQISDAPISYTDLQQAYVRLLDGKESGEVFDWREGQDRERRFLWYDFNEDTHMVEYLQTGEAGDMSTMKQTGREYFSNL